MTTTTFEVTLQQVTCCTCSMTFAMPEMFYRKRREDHDRFYCPAGHSQHYTGPSEERKLREQAELREQHLRDRLVDVNRTNESLKRQVSATKGQVTKLRNRAEKGLCLHCNRYFADMHKHVATKHPDPYPESVSPA